MTFRKYLGYIKDDMQRAKKQLDDIYSMRIAIVFALDIIGVLCFALLKEEFPLPIFFVLVCVNALIIIDSLWHILKENIQNNMPYLYDDECKKYGNVQSEFTCRINFIGNVRFRGFSGHIYIYSDAVLLKFGKRCLVINKTEQIKLNKVIFGYRCELECAKKYVQCSLNSRQAESLQNWIQTRDTM